MRNDRLTRASVQIALAILFALVGFAAAGCIAVGGSDTRNYQAPTLGKQLQDLKTAKDNGALTDAEYNDAKSKLISGDYERKK